MAVTGLNQETVTLDNKRFIIEKPNAFKFYKDLVTLGELFAVPYTALCSDDPSKLVYAASSLISSLDEGGFERFFEVVLDGVHCNGESKSCSLETFDEDPSLLIPLAVKVLEVRYGCLKKRDLISLLNPLQTVTATHRATS